MPLLFGGVDPKEGSEIQRGSPDGKARQQQAGNPTSIGTTDTRIAAAYKRKGQRYEDGRLKIED